MRVLICKPRRQKLIIGRVSVLEPIILTKILASLADRRGRSIRIPALVIALLIGINMGWAGSTQIRPDDYKEVYSVWKRARNLTSDVMEAGKPSLISSNKSFHCFKLITERLLILEADLRVGFQMVGILFMISVAEEVDGVFSAEL